MEAKMLNAGEALERLREGNRRFASNQEAASLCSTADRRARLIVGQEPSAVDHLRHGSELLERLIREDGLVVVGAEYSLETGAVDFFDGIADAV
jgi:carbonic anhydrase